MTSQTRPDRNATPPGREQAPLVGMAHTSHALADYLRGLVISQGPGVGEPMELLPWQHDLVGLFDSTGPVNLTVARKNGKTTLCAGIAAASLTGPLMQPRADTVLAAATLRQARIAFDHVRWFLRDELRDKRRFRVQNTVSTAEIEDRETGAKLFCIGAGNPDAVHGLAIGLAIIDEPAKHPRNTRDSLISAVRTSAGATESTRIISLGTRPDNPLHWFSKALEADPARSLDFRADPEGDPFDPGQWKMANPSYEHFAPLRAALKSEARLAKADPVKLAEFKALRLNLGTAEQVQSELLPASLWASIEVGAVSASPGYVLGVDLASGSAMSAAAMFDPGTNELDVFAFFPTSPSLAQRGLSDGVGSLYADCAIDGDLLQAPLQRTESALLGEALSRWGVPSVIVFDSYRETFLREALQSSGMPAGVRLRSRRSGPYDGAEDVQRFRRRCLARQVAPRASLLMRSSMREARVITDTKGNAMLAKVVEAGRRKNARDDCVAASILAVAEGDRIGAAPARDGKTWSVARAAR